MSADERSPADAPGLSFCIITDGRRPRKLRREIESIRALDARDCQILVGGIVPEPLGGVERVPLVAEARAGRLGAMRNALVSRAIHAQLVVCDDDLIFHPGFGQAVLRAGARHPALAVRVLNPDGTRYWDWCSHGGPHGHRLLPYTASASHLYASGAICVLRREVAQRVRWDDRLGFYEEEDVDFSRRLGRAGVALALCAEAVVTHDDARYRQRGARVRRMRPARRAGHALRIALRDPAGEARRLVDRRARPRPVEPTPVEAARLLERGGDWRNALLLVGVPADPELLPRLAAALSGLTALPLAVPFAPKQPGLGGDALARYRRPGSPQIQPVVEACAEALRGAAHVRWPGWVDRRRADWGARCGAWLEGSRFALSGAALAEATGARGVLVVGDATATSARRPAAVSGGCDPVRWLLGQPELVADHLEPYRAQLTASGSAALRAGAAWAAIHHVLLRQAATRGWLVVHERDLRRSPRRECDRILAYAALRARARGWRLADRLLPAAQADARGADSLREGGVPARAAPPARTRLRTSGRASSRAGPCPRAASGSSPSD